MDGSCSGSHAFMVEEWRLAAVMIVDNIGNR